ncbi:patatin-like phospholipase family protein [Ruegeria arenilitoris]|uniref:patatin-like phospholipase family protein n=1 Tax=Ruegeria arenilitoris TaxID=1173585 RepID=UPI003C79B2AC
MLEFLRIRTGIVLSAVLGLAACSAPEIDGPTCTGLVRDFVPAKSVVGRSSAPNVDATADLFARVFEGQAAQRANLDRDGRGVPVEILAMTTGGQYGAFSSGVLTGWTENGRPDFNVVTGASAGALITPLAFAGSAFDARLKSNTRINLNDVLSLQIVPPIPLASSVFSTKKLKRLVESEIDEPLLDRIAERADPGQSGQEVNSVVVGAVNLKTGRFDIMDIGQYLATTPDDFATKEDCVSEAVLASSAIPVLFPPRKINGDLYADAGVRQHVFLEGLAQGQQTATQRTGQQFDIRVTLLVNGDLVVAEKDPGPGILALAGRNFQLVTDQGFRESIDRTLRVVKQNPSWTFKALVAPELPALNCKNPEPLFDKCITGALFEAGKNMTSSQPIPWLTAAELERKINEIYGS